MGWSDKISDIIEIDNHTPSLVYWANVLNWTEENIDSLSLIDLEYLASESERCREFWNKDHEKVVVIQKNGKMLEHKLKSEGLDIPKEDVFPNIHKMIEQKLEQQRIEEIPPETNVPSRTEDQSLRTDIIPLAAAPQ